MVRRLYSDSLAWSNSKKGELNDQSQGCEGDGELRLQGKHGLPLQPVHVQELQLLIVRYLGALGRSVRGRPALRSFLCPTHLINTDIRPMGMRAAVRCGRRPKRRFTAFPGASSV